MIGPCTLVTTADGGCYGDFSLLTQDGGGWDNTVTSVSSLTVLPTIYDELTM
jgi:hypothetical protein